MKILSLDINYNIVSNLLIIKNNTEQYTEKIYITITDATTNLNVFSWWAFFSPLETQELNLPYSFYENVKEFDVNILDSSFEVIFRKNFLFKKETNKLFFHTKNKREINFDAWHSLVYKKEYDITFKTSDVVYDLGANVGVFSRWVLLNNVKHIYAYEPDPELFECLKKTFIDDNNISIYNNAILDENIERPFYISEHSVSNNLFNGNYKIVDVDCINLENHIQNNNLIAPTIIKCDIEGAEFQFMKSLSDNFLKPIRIFILEFHIKDENVKNNLYNIIERLLQLRYTCRLTNISKFENKMGTIIFEKNI